MSPDSESVRVLVIDDDEACFELLVALIDELGPTPYQLSWCSSWVAGRAALEQDEHDLYLIDHGLGARTGIELREAASAALRRWARPSSMITDDKEAELAAREFLVLYGELQADRKMARSQREPLRHKIRGRLMALAGQIKKRVAVEKRLADAKRPESVNAAKLPRDVLGQRRGFGGRGFGGPGFGGGMMGGGRFGGGPPNDDHGEELVELIQKTIAPHTWDVNGGLGSIYYWRQGRALIIRQTGDVHDQIGGVLEQMGKMGR